VTVDPLSGCWPHWEKQLAAARREGVIEGRAQAEAEMQSKIDAAVADCERRCATQLADHISRAADDERVRIDAAVAREREAIVATLQEHGEYYLAGIVEDRARSAKGV
jgi:hypothetical protein